MSTGDVTWTSRAVNSTRRLAPHEVPVLTADAPQYVLVIGRLAGGRRLLSDDLAMLERVALLLARRIDALRLTDERYDRMLREREMRTLATEAELTALRAQINPHFLFNALTTIGYLIEAAPTRALDTLMRLTTILRAVLRSDGEFTTLRRERELVHSYLQIERERFEERAVGPIGHRPRLRTRGQYLERIPVRRRDEVTILPVRQIASVVAEAELLHITTIANERYTITHRLHALEARLDPRRFLRLARGTLANIDLINRVSPMPGGTYHAKLSNGQELAVSRIQARVLRETLLKL